MNIFFNTQKASLSSVKSVILDSKVQKSVQKIVDYVSDSLSSSYWDSDGNTLDAKQGKKVFKAEIKASKAIAKLLKKNPKKQYFDGNVASDLNVVNSWLVKADEMLAKAAYQMAKNRIVLNSKVQKKYDKKISSAEKNLATAASQSVYDKQMKFYSKAWIDAQNAIKYADKPPKASGKDLVVDEDSYLSDEETEPDE